MAQGSIQGHLDFEAGSVSGRILTNVDRRTMGRALLEDYEKSDECLCITGFSSLSYLIELLGDHPRPGRRVRVLIGSEELGDASPTGRALTTERFSAEVADHWTRRGISLQTAPALLEVVDLVESGTVSVRLLPRLHAKLYCLTGTAYIGSSNLSRSGMHHQYEANLRLQNEEDDAANIRDAAEWYWDRGTESTEWLLSLLKRLLKVVQWQDALARAVAEVLESQWIKEFPQLDALITGMRLWPSQEAAIGQALYILDNHGSVLIADPTGSGKSRVGVVLQVILEARLMRERGVYSRPRSVVICPPVVLSSWEAEYRQLRVGSPEIISHGRLQVSSESQRLPDITAREAIHNADVLFIDEAHNYLNRASNRSRKLDAATPDKTLLFTATPISRSVSDVFRLVELLDIDSFSDGLQEHIVQLQKDDRHGRSLDRNELGPMLRQFTIRRTKDDLNRMIDAAPSRYTDDRGRPCRYPGHDATTFELHETEHDLEVAERIVELAGQLQGIARLRKIERHGDEIARGVSPDQVVHRRLQTARALTQYQVLQQMRSSTAALVEHVAGTPLACERYGLQARKTERENGNMRNKVRGYANRLPTVDNELPIPDFLVDPVAYAEACHAEAAVYDALYREALEFEDSREKSKVALLRKLADEHGRILAFDSCLITLQLLSVSIGTGVPCILVTGETDNEHELQEKFGLYAENQRLVALCSDTMAEGVNLQGAADVVLLSMPSVMRIAEQRIGRVDRLNSPHSAIRVYWPQDADLFTLDTDERFYRTARDVEELIGSNIEIPTPLTERRRARRVSRSSGVPALPGADHDSLHAAIQDAFAPLRELTAGPAALIDHRLYDSYREVSEPVISCVSVVRSLVSFSFFCLQGTEDLAPQWVVRQPDNQPITDLAEIASFLKSYLPDSEPVDLRDPIWRHVLTAAGREVQNLQWALLPHRGRRALDVVRFCLDKEHRQPGNRQALIEPLLAAVRPEAGEDGRFVDLKRLAREAVRVLLPAITAVRRRSSWHNLKSVEHIKRLYTRGEFSLSDDDLRKLLAAVNYQERTEDRVVAAIIGVGRRESAES